MISKVPLSKEIELVFDELFPICRSITGGGVRESLKILSGIRQIDVFEETSGKAIYDWEVPEEWTVNSAFIDDEFGNRILDFSWNNLHLVGYSVPFEGWLSLEELNNHLYSLPELPNAIPYVTSYYKKSWGFCIEHQKRLALHDCKYFVNVDTKIQPGSMTWGQIYFPGKSEKEFLFSTYLCHPSMANNELSGPLIAAFLSREIQKLSDLKYSYRFVFAPETVGTINFISKYEKHLSDNLIGGLILSCIGDGGPYTYKKTFSGTNYIDVAIVNHLKRNQKRKTKVMDYFPWGSDERQYNSPGLRLPVGCLSRTMYGEYDEYHTSLDSKKLMNFDLMAETIQDLSSFVESIDKTWLPISNVSKCEPKLDKRNLYRTTSQSRVNYEDLNAIRWVLLLADGKHDLSMMESRSGLNLTNLIHVAGKLRDLDLIV